MKNAALSLAAAVLFLAPGAAAETLQKEKKAEPRWVEEDYQSIQPGDIDEKFKQRPPKDGPDVKFDYEDPDERNNEYGLDRLGEPQDRLGAPY